MVRRSRIARIFGVVWKLLLFALLCATVGVLLWRMLFSRTVPGEIKRIDPNDTLIAAYKEHGDALAVVRRTHISDLDPKGYFAVTDACFYPDADQVQMVFRYNHSTLTSLKNDYGLEAVPAIDGDYFDFSVVVKDRDGSEHRYAAEAEPVRADTSLYTYYRITVNGVAVGEETDSVFLDVYYKEDINYQKDAYGIILLYSSGIPTDKGKLSSGDLRILKQAAEAAGN